MKKPRMLLGQRLYWTEKYDGSNVAIWLKEDTPVISSRNMEQSSTDIQDLVKRTKHYSKLLDLLKELPHCVLYVEACRKGRSVTGIEVYDEDTLVLFDIYNRDTEKFLPHILVHQNAFHHQIPIVKLYAETRHRSMKDLLKFKNHVLDYCKATNIEGMVIKAYKIPKQFQEWYARGLIMAKVKLDVPEPIKKKIVKGEPIYPTIPENEIIGAISKVEADFGLTGNPKDDMPRIAQYVNEEMGKHLYSKPKGKLFSYYQKYMEKLT